VSITVADAVLVSLLDAKYTLVRSNWLTNIQQAKVEPNKKQRAEKQNSAVYVTSLPLDATVEEINEVFSKYGIIAEEIDSNKPRIKLYTDEDGKPKGDALVVYFRPESVALAIQMLDDSDFRWGVKGPDGAMRVKVAETSYKRTQHAANTEKQAPVRRSNRGDKQKIIEKTARLNQRLAEWSDDDGGAILNAEVKKEAKKASKWEKVVVLKHMFTQEGLAKEMEEDPTTKEDLLEDVKDQCLDSGDVLDLSLYDLEVDGIITVRFAQADAAQDCVQRLNGRKFDGRTVEAYISTGERFKKSRLTDMDEEAERKRLEAFAERIENMPDS
jgi:HIV Tat-specific factor 1